MNKYEITYLSTPTLSEDTRNDLDASIDKAIDKLNGSIEQSTDNIRRKLFFPIKDQMSGFLRTLQIELDPKKINTLHKKMKKIEGILRFSILNTPLRKDVPAEMLETPAPQEKESTQKKSLPEKEVTMKEVEEGIEEVLEEEVK